jgi:hypothetical protein
VVDIKRGKSHRVGACCFDRGPFLLLAAAWFASSDGALPLLPS